MELGLELSVTKRHLSGIALSAHILLDNFDSGVDDATLAGRAPIIRPNVNTWGVPSGVFVTKSGKAEARFPTINSAVVRVDTGIASCELSMDFILPASGSNRSAGILYRYTNITNYWYTLANLDTQKFRIFELTAGVATQRGTEADFEFLPNVKYTMRLLLTGDYMFSSIDEIAAITHQSSVRNTATFHGLRATNTIAAEAIKFDNFDMLVAPAPADNYVTVNPAVLMTSNYKTSITHMSGPDLRTGNAVARERAKASLATALELHRVSTHLYGVSDPWNWNGVGTRPAEPTNWNSLDATLQMVRDMNGEPILGFGNWSWHLKGKWTGGLNTTLCTVADAFDENGRPLTDQVTALRLFVRRTAERYLPAATHNVRWWQTTNWEAHGFERDRAGGFDVQGFDDHPGTAGQADMGMAYLHNIVYDELMQVADELNIERSELNIITGYFRINTRGVPSSDSVAVGHDLREKAWGTANSSGIDSILGHLPLLTAGSWDYWSYDIGSLNKDDVVLTDDWTNLQRFTDIGVFIRDAVAAIGFGSKGCFVSERYTKPQTDPGVGKQQYRAAINADSERRFLLLGLDGAMYWSPIGRANEPGAEAEAGLITSVATSSGGQTQPAFDVVKGFHEEFSPSTPIHDVTIIGSGITALASDEKVLLINHTDVSKLVAVGAVRHDLAPYEAKWVDHIVV